tara:strand:- start:90 stop:962 length:873 start_codon:yes stop_codon:yes gene_type:complete
LKKKLVIQALVAILAITWVVIDASEQDRKDRSQKVLCFECKLDTAEKIEIQFPNGQYIKFAKVSGLWRMQEPFSDKASYAELTLLENLLSRDSVLTWLESDPTVSFSKYTLKMNWDDLIEVTVATQQAVGGKNFVMLGDGRYAVVNSTWSTVIPIRPEEWADDFVFGQEIMEIQSIDFRFGENTFLIEKRGEGWVDSHGVVAKTGQVNKYISGLRDLKAKKTQRVEPDQDTFVFARIELSEGQVLQLKYKQVDEEVFLFRDDRPIVFIVDREQFDKMKWSREDFVKSLKE